MFDTRRSFGISSFPYTWEQLHGLVFYVDGDGIVTVIYRKERDHLHELIVNCWISKREYYTAEEFFYALCKGNSEQNKRYYEGSFVEIETSKGPFPYNKPYSDPQWSGYDAITFTHFTKNKEKISTKNFLMIDVPYMVVESNKIFYSLAWEASYTGKN